MTAQSEKNYRFTLVGTAHPYRGGIAHFIEIMYHGFLKRGHNASIVTFTRQYPGLFFPGKTQLVEEPVENPVPTQPMIDTINPFSWIKTATYLRRHRPDALIFKYWMPFFAPAFGTIARSARKNGIRIFTVVDNALPHEKRLFDRQLSAYFLNANDGLVVMSDSVERDIRSLGIEKPIRRVAHPVYEIFGKPVEQKKARDQIHLPRDKKIILFFGFIRRYKGLHVLLQAMPQIVKALPDLHLVVAGEFYDDEAFYRRILQQHQLEEHVSWYNDYIPEEDVYKFFSAADLVVQPYVSATQSGVAQIAYNFNQPLVVTDVGGLAEIVPHNKAGLVVPPQDPQALAKAVIRFFDEKMRDELVKGVKTEKQKYSWDRLYEAIESLMQEVG
jgi:glycosyltransferase involved in cell wall biosynthesis